MSRPSGSPDRTELIRRGDAETIATVARETMDLLFRAARTAGIAEDDAPDIVQETLLVFVRRCAEFDGRASPRTWLYGILLKKISERRRTWRREESFDDIDSIVADRFDVSGNWLHPVQPPDAYAAGGQALEWLNDCLETLPERRRVAFLLREIEQLHPDEICNILDVSRNNLGVLLFRARNALRECMELKGIHGSADIEL